MKTERFKNALASAAATLTLGILPAYAQNNPPTYSPTATYIEGDLVKIGINYYRALNTNTNKSPLNYNGSWELYRVRANNTVSPAVYRIYVRVGHSFSNLYNAWNYASSAVIDKTATVQLFIDTSKGNLNENFNAALSLDAACGKNIQIVGDNAANINLNFSNQTSGFTLDGGNTLGLLENVTINGASAPNSIGISLDDNASMTLENVSVNNFPTGVYVTNASKLKCIPPVIGNSITISGCGIGIYAQDNSFVSCRYGVLTGSSAASSTAIEAYDHCEINATRCQVSQVNYGFFCAEASTIIAPVTTDSTPSGTSYYATGRSYINCESSTGYYYYADTDSFMNALNSTNTGGGYVTDSNLGTIIDH